MLCDLGQVPFSLWASLPPSGEGLPDLVAGISGELVLEESFKK